MSEHRLKCWPEYYRELRLGRKPFELRRDDRGFKTGDTLALAEFEPCKRCSGTRRKLDNGDMIECCTAGGKFTGKVVKRRVRYILTDHEGLEEGFVCMGLGPV